MVIKQKIKSPNMEEFDILWQTMEKPEYRKTEHLWITPKYRLHILFDKLKKKFRTLLGYEDIPQNLNDLSIGALLESAEAEKPSIVIDKICKDLNIILEKDEDKQNMFVLWNKEIKRITELLSKANPNLIDHKADGVFQSVAKNRPISPIICMIDNMSKRFGISWEEASKLKWSVVYLANQIDARTAEFDEKYRKQLEMGRNKKK